jgi:hypothetical protein
VAASLALSDGGGALKDFLGAGLACLNGLASGVKVALGGYWDRLAHGYGVLYLAGFVNDAFCCLQS